jgi:hypothetical protein
MGQVASAGFFNHIRHERTFLALRRDGHSRHSRKIDHSHIAVNFHSCPVKKVSLLAAKRGGTRPR